MDKQTIAGVHPRRLFLETTHLVLATDQSPSHMFLDRSLLTSIIKA
jgi:hypothetical protein